MSNRRNRDRNKRSLRSKLNDLPDVPYEEVANATYRGDEVVNQWFGDIDPSTINESGIQIADDGAISAYEFRMTGIGIDPESRSLNEEKWRQLGDLLFRFERSIQWLIGDWLAYGEANNWGNTEKIAEDFGYEVKTLYDYTNVARTVPFSVRTENLSFGHHKLVARTTMTEEEQSMWLEKAEIGDYDAATNTSKVWSISRLRNEMKGISNDTNETPFERSVQRIEREVTKNKWKRLPADERLKRYEYLKSILSKMEEFGFD